jgi:hypothetical protein
MQMRLLATGLLVIVILLPVDTYAQREAKSGWIEDGPSQESEKVEGPASSGDHKRMLQGSVEHSVTLPPLPDNLRVGAIFDQGLLAPHPDVRHWYQIPPWLAGQWARDEETILSAYYYDSHQRVNEPQTIAAKETTEFGLQVDKLGDVWHCRIAAGGVADCGSYYSIALVGSQQPVQVSDNEVVIRDEFTELHVNKETSVITLALQAESLTRFRPVKDGVVESKTSVKFFEEDGSPKSIQRNLAYEKRTSGFSELNSYKGHDLRAEFREFLRSNGKESLLPDDRVTTQKTIR